MLCRPMLVNLLMCPRAKLTAPGPLRKATTRTPAKAQSVSGEAGRDRRIAPELCRPDGARRIQRELADPSGAGPRIGCKAGEAN